MRSQPRHRLPANHRYSNASARSRQRVAVTGVRGRVQRYDTSDTGVRAMRLALVTRAVGRVALGMSVVWLGAGCRVVNLWEPTDEQILARILPSAVQIILEQQEGRRKN